LNKQGLTGKDQDKDKHQTHKDQDKDKNQTLKDKDKDEDLKSVLKDSLRTKINITEIYWHKSSGRKLLDKPITGNRITQDLDRCHEWLTWVDP